jgi:hypothetical protein
VLSKGKEKRDVKKNPNLVANGRFQAWWLMEGSKLGGRWEVPSLVALGMFHAWRSMGKHFA